MLDLAGHVLGIAEGEGGAIHHRRHPHATHVQGAGQVAEIGGDRLEAEFRMEVRAPDARAFRADDPQAQVPGQFVRPPRQKG